MSEYVVALPAPRLGLVAELTRLNQEYYSRTGVFNGALGTVVTGLASATPINRHEITFYIEIERAGLYEVVVPEYPEQPRPRWIKDLKRKRRR